MKSHAYYRDFIRARILIDANGCWLWQKFVHREPNPYGSAYAWGKNWRVHRLAYLLWIGPLDPKLDVCHTCDVKHCCNPDHLWQGTPKSNMQDAAKKRIWSRQHKTHCPKGHPLNGGNLYIAGGRKRNCKTCSRIRQRIVAGWPRDLAESMPQVGRGYTRDGISVAKAAKHNAVQPDEGHSG